MLLNGDCLEKLKELPENSVDSLVTDPPAGISFMGKSWDGDMGGRKQWIAWMAEVMTECLRVMKPGSHGLVWALPRTSHWTATALEDAGFEIRDVVTHLFGSGFPKSLDISKAIDKAAGAEREQIGIVNRTGKEKGCLGAFSGPSPITTPATDAAKEWQGWGTALKPASEHWVLIRKPCSEKTVAANVLKWGTGGINIDAGRIHGDGLKPTMNNPMRHGRYNSDNSHLQRDSEYIPNNAGRFPANLLFSHTPHCTEDMCDLECAIKRLDEQSGTLKTGGLGSSGQKIKGNATDFGWERKPRTTAGDSGGASRFFYCAKISTSERNSAVPNGHPTVKAKKLMGYLIKLITPPGGVVLDPFMGSGSTGIAAKESGFEFIGIEKEKEYFEIAKARVTQSRTA